MPAPYTAAQIAVAEESFAFWQAKGATDMQAACLLADEDGETSFLWKAIGDRGEAVGSFQWHDARANNIQIHTGIDVRHATHRQMLDAAYWEMSNSQSWYKKVWPALMATETIGAGITVLVQKYEQSGSQARDIARRSGLAEYWVQYARDNWEVATS